MRKAILVVAAIFYRCEQGMGHLNVPPAVHVHDLPCLYLSHDIVGPHLSALGSEHRALHPTFTVFGARELPYPPLARIALPAASFPQALLVSLVGPGAEGLGVCDHMLPVDPSR